jgi:hypothetical protein
MSAITLSSPVYPYRLFTFEVDGVPHSKAFDHPATAGHGALDAELNREFHAWLESVRPGYFDAGRVHRIAFTDRIRHAENMADAVDGLTAWGNVPELPPVPPAVFMPPDSCPPPVVGRHEDLDG